MSFSSVHDVSVVHHLSKLLIVHSLTQLSGNSLEAVEVSVSVALLIPKLEKSGDTIAGFNVTNS